VNSIYHKDFFIRNKFISGFFFQINFFKDHTKIILCPLLGGVTYIDELRQARTYSLELIEKFGCNAELSSRLSYTLDKVETMMNASKSQTGPQLVRNPTSVPVK
jgi:polo-like kinase 1